MLQPFVGLHPEDDDMNLDMIYSGGDAALALDGRRLHIICLYWRSMFTAEAMMCPVAVDEPCLPLKVATLTVDLVDRTVSPQAPLLFRLGAYQAASAHGELWAPVILVDEFHICRLVVHRLVVDGLGGGSNWEEVIGYQFPKRPEPVDRALFSGTVLPGYAVIDDRFILLSIINSTFFCFHSN
jgi:hypothetical protein